MKVWRDWYSRRGRANWTSRASKVSGGRLSSALEYIARSVEETEQDRAFPHFEEWDIPEIPVRLPCKVAELPPSLTKPEEWAWKRRIRNRKRRLRQAVKHHKAARELYQIWSTAQRLYDAGIIRRTLKQYAPHIEWFEDEDFGL